MSEIINTIIKTKNIKKAMVTYATENFTPLNECDFEIKKTATYIKTNSDDSFKLFNENIKEHYKEEKDIINQHVEFQQIYTIMAMKPTNMGIKLSYSLEMGEYHCTPKLILHPDSHILYKVHKPKEMYILLLQEINKIKAKNGILINIYDDKMVKNLKAFTKYLYEGKFVKKVRIPLFEGIEPVINSAGKLILWFKHKESQQKHLIIEVEKDEVLVEYKKPKYGKSGFDSHGKLLDTDYTNNADDLQTVVDNDSVYIEENDDKKLYKSKLKGFVQFSNVKLSVDNKVKMAKLSRVEDSLAKEEANNIEVHISQNDTTKDSIGEGVELTSETIHVNGHIGANSILEAVNMQIDGATHQDSTQFARIAMINRHKGTLRCHEAKIALLEGGTVHATNVEIEACLGGVIYAQNVKIGHVKSNLKVYASKSISITLVSGEDNIFKINYKDIPIIKSRIDLIIEDIEELKLSLEEAKRHNIALVRTLQDQIKKFKDEVQEIKDSTSKATISIQKPLRGLNSIIFTLENDEEIIYKTEAHSYKPFFLDITEEKITLQPVKKTIFL
ncbi:flagellar assembly protein A [Sulfurimonas sp.]|uniref:flagellar assembly protein A n=1 Tax=Sulfurimonas sp. TaxID=2022749 RepID=UPI0025EC368C|nr:flagellar assembly protein A [Sulfurimonas sp.]